MNQEYDLQNQTAKKKLAGKVSNSHLSLPRKKTRFNEVFNLCPPFEVTSV